MDADKPTSASNVSFEGAPLIRGEQTAIRVQKDNNRIGIQSR
jgi:hypothetical protein